jgi:hypothetical protein
MSQDIPVNEVGLDLPWVLVAIGAAGLLLLAIFLALGLSARRRKPVESPTIDLVIDVQELPANGPPNDGPKLEFYGIPVRLAVLVLAPAGRNAQLPSHQKLVGVLDDLVPGLASVVLAHRPLLRQWPGQLSSQGFIYSFFSNVRLPGDRGKGTPWCSTAGRFDAEGQQLLAGFLCAAEKPNSMSQVAISDARQWMEVLRVKR